MSDDQSVRYECDGDVATITMDDGKANALSPALQQAIHRSLDRAESDAAAVVLAGRPGRFSAGFDLGVIVAGGETAAGMVVGGFELAHRLLSVERPVVIACTGHAMAMGAFLLLSGDHRIGAAGSFKIAANEVAIGMTMPYSPIELMRQRLTPAGVQRSTILAETFDPDGAVAVGYLDQLVEPDEVVSTAQALAAGMMSSLDLAAHRETKLRVRSASLDAIRTAIEQDRSALASRR